jgi:hypothetical protein
MSVGVPAAVGHDVRGDANGGSTDQWGQAPTAVGHGGVFLPPRSTAAGGLASWPTAAGGLASWPTVARPWRRGPRRQRRGYIRGQAPAACNNSGF